MEPETTPLGPLLERGLYACGIVLRARKGRGSVLLDEWFGALYAEADPARGQFVELAGWAAQGQEVRLEHLLAVQGVRTPLPTLAAAAAAGELYEIVSLWKPPRTLILPHFEVTAKVGGWYVDTLEPCRHPYDPSMMTLRVLQALLGRLDLPGDRVPPLYELD